MSTDSVSTQLCSLQLDDIWGPDLTQFKTLTYQLISKDEGQVSRSKDRFHLALRSRPDSLLLALYKLLSSDLPLLRALAAKHLDKIFTTFSSNFLNTTLDTFKSDLLSASRHQLLDLDVRNHSLRTISNFHSTGSGPELLPYLFECVDSQSHFLPEYALLVFKSLAENSKGNATVIPHLETFHKIFSECLGSCSSWDIKIADLDASISFVQFIPNREDLNRFDYLLRLMMLTLTQALNSGSKSRAENSLRLLIKFAETNPRFFERQLEKVLWLMLKITVDDSLEVDTRHLAIKFLMELVEKAPGMIRKEPQFIVRLFDELMYMLFDIEYVHVAAPDLAIADAAAAAAAAAADAAAAAAAAAADADAGGGGGDIRANAAADADAAAADAATGGDIWANAAAAAAAASAAAAAAAAANAAAAAAASAAAAAAAARAAAVRAAAAFDDFAAAVAYDDVAAAAIAARDAAALAAAARGVAVDPFSGGDEVGNFWESSNYILGKKSLSKLSILLGEKTIFQCVLRLFSHLLGNSIWQQRHAVLIAIQKIAGGCYKMMLENLEEIVPMVLKSANDWHPRVQLAAINAIEQLSVDLGPELQTQYPDIVLITLAEVMKGPRRDKLAVHATSAMLNFLANRPKTIIDE